MPTEECNEELETLAAIFLDDLNIRETSTGNTRLSIVLYPATGDDEESRYVTLTLEIELSAEYPETLPKIVFKNPRGLNEFLLNEMLNRMFVKCEELRGSQMVFELIDMAKEFLTSNNRPASECPICLLSFTESDVFFRSDCFHHFHSHCLGKYLQSIEQKESTNEDTHPKDKGPEKTCPVCRIDLPKTIDINRLLEQPPPTEETDFAMLDTEALLSDWNDKRDSMNKLFLKQKSQGGIIDLTDKCKNLLVISSPVRNQGHETEHVSSSSATENRSSGISQPVNVSSFTSQAAKGPATVSEAGGSTADLQKGQQPQGRSHKTKSTKHPTSTAESGSQGVSRYHGGHRRRNK